MIISLLFAFLLGSIPIGYLIGRFRGVDLRREGSGNIGTTNAARILGRGFGFLTLVGDTLKGFYAVLLFAPHRGLPEDLVLLALAAILGHCFTPFLWLHGGKGVATAFGGFLAVSPMAAVLSALAFFLVLGISRYVSLASIVAVSTLPFTFAWATADPLSVRAILALAAASAVVIARHAGNIRRLAHGAEPRFGALNTAPSPLAPSPRG